MTSEQVGTLLMNVILLLLFSICGYTIYETIWGM